jgi:hypothetical protein
VILQEGDNKYKEGRFGEGEVAGETGEWVNLDALDLGSFKPENTIYMYILLKMRSDFLIGTDLTLVVWCWWLTSSVVHNFWGHSFVKSTF